MASSTGSFATSAQHNFRHHRSHSNKDEEEAGCVKDGLALPSRSGKDHRSLSTAGIYGARSASVAGSVAPGSFSSTLKTTQTHGPRPGALRTDFSSYMMRDETGPPGDGGASERRQAEFRDKINKEMKIKTGSENLLEALLAKNAKQTKDQRQRVESELSSSNKKIAELKSQLQEEIQRSKRPPMPALGRLSSLFRVDSFQPSPSAGFDEAHEYEGNIEAESPTYLLAEILQALEIEGMQPDYYVSRANGLVDLFKRHPTLKYDLVWSIFGLRVQIMLLSESRDVVAAGYRVTRHAIADRKSLQTIRSLQTDSLVVLSLAKDSKATIEREQALKFVRAFLDTKDGVKELSNAVIRAVVSVAEHYEDRLRNIAILTLSEVLIKHPSLVVAAGGIIPLTDSLKDGSYPGSESLISAFLYLTDTPALRRFLRSGLELEGPFGLFSDSLSILGHEERLKNSMRSIAATLNAWPGLFALSQNGFASLSSLLLSLSHPAPFARDLILDLLFDVLRIKPPSWTPSFLAGRRLTTFGRVANLSAESMEHHSRLESEDDLSRANLVDHYTALVLAILVRCGMLQALSLLMEEPEDLSIRRKATLLLNEVLKLANHALPNSLSAGLQSLPGIVNGKYVKGAADEEVDAFNMVYQMDSVNRTLQRSVAATRPAVVLVGRQQQQQQQQHAGASKGMHSGPPKLSVDMDEIHFRSLLVETQVVSSANYLKWNWDLILDIVEGPLLNPKRFEDAAKATKFLKRLVGFYRPFKYRFSDVKNTKPNQRYVRAGCALIKTLLKTAEGVQYLLENKLLRQLAECLAQLDRTSGITSNAPLFSADRVSETLTGGYFALLGAMSSDAQGLAMISRWRIVNMFYHIIDLYDRDDIVQLLLGNMDFTLDSHLRVMLSRALTACSKLIRIYATKLLRKYATREISAGNAEDNVLSVAYWAIRLLVTQLYDPDVEVSEVAVQILQEACNRKQYLEYVVKCRPALDHLGEIGAPLLLRFLSTSLGYRYLDGLDYITHEMDDWFLGRNEKYVTLVEASLSRAFSSASAERPKSQLDEPAERLQLGIVPPHFYRELTRTKEGCQLLRESGHFEEFVSTVKEFWAEEEDPETILKVKGCLWAIGNVGSMELGSFFLERFDTIGWIIMIAEQSGVITLRGTAFFVLGLISRSWHGMEILAEHGWDAATNHLGRSLGYVLPLSLDNLFTVPKRVGVPAEPPPAPAILSDMPALADANDAQEKRIYHSVIESGNTVLSRRALNELNIIKSKKPELFRSTIVFRNIMFVLECHNIRLPIRQRIIDMFDREMMRQIVLDESSEDEQESERGTARPSKAS